MTPADKDAFSARRRALEDSFFGERDRQLLARLQGELGQLEERQKLASVSGIRDDQVLKDLISSGLRAETLAALRLIPMVVVAWSDGKVSDAEAKSVQRAAFDEGVNESSACHELLSKWLASPPDSTMVSGWKEYMRQLSKVLPPETLQKLRQGLQNRLQSVAKATGGFLGMQSISEQEQKAIDELVDVLRA